MSETVAAAPPESSSADAYTAAEPPAPSDALVRSPQQDRSRRTLARLEDAALEILEIEGPEALTLTGLTRAARTSVGSFYARFDGKDELLRYLGERSLEAALASWDGFDASENGDLRPALRAAVDTLGRLHLEGPGRALLLLDGVEDPPPTRRRRLEEKLTEALAAQASVPELRAGLAARVVTSLLQDALLRRLPIERELLLDELVELLVGYLGGEVRTSAPSDDGPQVDDAQVEDDAPQAPDEPSGDPSAEPDPFDVWV